MVNTILDVSLLFFVFTLIGVGPTLWFSDAKQLDHHTLAIAPSLGLILTALIGTYLVLLDYPIHQWAFIWLVAGSTASFIIGTIAIKKKYADITVQNFLKVDKEVGFFCAGLVAIFCFLTLPMLVGGLDYTILRGNGHDDFNYITLAGALVYEPYSWLLHATVQELIDKHPQYILVSGLIKTRWSVSMLLGWFSVITHLPLYRIEYGFTLVFYLLLYCASYGFARLLKLSALMSMLTALTIGIGFWGQYVLDIRAMSQISSLPLIVTFAYILSTIDKQKSELTKYIFFALTLSAMVYLYIEILPLVLLAVVIFASYQLTNKEMTLEQGVKFFFSLVLTVILIIPALKWIVFGFLKMQMNFALNTSNSWWTLGFPWLYDNSIIGFWGLSILNHGVITQALLLVLGSMLSCILLYFIFKKIFQQTAHWPLAYTAAFSFVVSTFIMFLYLLDRQQLWAAGKGLSFGYPFIIFLLVFALSQARQVQHRNKLIKAFNKVMQRVVLIWLVIQLFLGVYRVAYAAQAIDYKHYIKNNAGYREHDWNISNIQQVITNKNIKNVGLLLKDDYTKEYFSIALGWQSSIYCLDGVSLRGRGIAGKQSMPQIPTHIIVDNQVAQNSSGLVLAKNSEFSLLDIGDKGAFAAIGQIESPNGVELRNGTMAIWLNDKATTISLFSTKDGIAVLSGQFGPGPSVTASQTRHLLVSIGENFQKEFSINTLDKLTVNVPVKKGTNHITLVSLDAPDAIAKTGDTRVMLIGASDLKINF